MKGRVGGVEDCNASLQCQLVLAARTYKVVEAIGGIKIPPLLCAMFLAGVDGKA